MPLTALFVARAAAGRATVGKYYDGDGLVMQVKPSGACAWVFRYDRDRRRHEIGLGAVKDVGLKEARDKAADYRRTLASGSDPLRAKRLNGHRTAGPTFCDVAEDYLASHSAGWRNAKHRRQWRDTLALAYPVIGHVAPADITATDIIAILKPIWHKIPATASRLRGRLQKVLAAAAARGLRSGPNPASWAGHLDAVFPRVGVLHPTEHHPALPVADMPKVVAKLKGTMADDDIAAAAVLFQILTSCRPGEARGLRWEEIDRANALWLLPAARHKTGKAWRCPLSRPTLALLDRMARLRVPGDPSAVLVFPGRKSGQPVSLTAMHRRFHTAGAKAATGEPATIHGNRSSFTDWAHTKSTAKTGAIDHQLGHGPRGTRAAYWRDDHLTARVPLMAEWAAYCHG